MRRIDDGQFAGLAFDGELRFDALHRLLYAQDASIYAEEPAGVAYPRHREDVQALVRMCAATGLALIPRAAGTSLAGQCVGDGLVVDVGRHMNEILELNVEERWVRVQPGVILDDLNRHLVPYGLFFGPDTSTANRCMIGGMVGNNSCGSHSILYGNTMQHVLELGVVFADGSYELLRPWNAEELDAHRERNDALGAGVRALLDIVAQHRELIESRYPTRDVLRRNTGYPLDDIACREPFGEGGAFSLARFLCGTEGTLGITTEVKLNLVAQPAHRMIVAAHFADLGDALRATVRTIAHTPAAVELIDRNILEQTKTNIEQRHNRFFIEGDPDAILVIEFYRAAVGELEAAAEAVIEELQGAGLGYAFPIVRPPDDAKVWALRKAGLGLLMGVVGDTKSVSVIEDTAVPVARLPEYVADIQALMARYETDTVYHAHASVGELHIRPALNLKERRDVDKMGEIASAVADLVREYRGSLSGEHGDGRVRSPYIEQFFGAEVVELHRRVKQAFDPQYIMNPRKIVDPEPIDADLRFEPGAEVPQVETLFDWTSDLGLVRATEKCNGAGACRKPAEAGGTMCPSYMATLDERDTTRGRANVFRQLLLEGPDTAMSSHVLYEAMDLCLSCKGCKRECPANVDLARLKAEFTQHYWDEHGTPLSALLFGHYAQLSRLAMVSPALANFVMTFGLTRWLMGVMMGLAPQRNLPAFAPRSFRSWFAGHPAPTHDRAVWLYVDPFTEYTEPELGQAAVEVLEACGFGVELFPVEDDGRTLLSKGLVRSAKKLVNRTLRGLGDVLRAHPERAVIGIEPSALLTFLDEWPDLAAPEHRATAEDLAGRAMMLDDFLATQLAENAIDVAWRGAGTVLLHGHCHQKALVGTSGTEAVLRAAGYDVTTLATGCCGMAGSFGYERKHYDVSQQIGELVLFPALREADDEVLVCAPGTSCRHQIADGVQRKARHPVLFLRDALRETA